VVLQHTYSIITLTVCVGHVLFYLKNKKLSLSTHLQLYITTNQKVWKVSFNDNCSVQGVCDM